MNQIRRASYQKAKESILRNSSNSRKSSYLAENKHNLHRLKTDSVNLESDFDYHFKPHGVNINHHAYHNKLPKQKRTTCHYTESANGAKNRSIVRKTMNNLNSNRIPPYRQNYPKNVNPGLNMEQKLYKDKENRSVNINPNIDIYEREYMERKVKRSARDHELSERFG